MPINKRAEIDSSHRTIPRHTAPRSARIVSVGGKAGPARREIAADGLLVTPGWVDIHTHYDGQVGWDPYLSPSSWNGVTMDGVEDIPTETLKAGINLEWDSFGEYLDALSRMRRVLLAEAFAHTHSLFDRVAEGLIKTHQACIGAADLDIDFRTA